MICLPKISIVTPSYNQAQYLEATIRSVVEQRYEPLEYIVVDGGSTDGSVDIIRRYESRLSHWLSEPDGGQADGIAKGMRLATGDVLAWLNADDTYEPGTIEYVGRFFASHPEIDILYGNYNRIDSAGRLLERKRQPTFHLGIAKYVYNMLMQPATFWTARVYSKVGGIDTRLRFSMDYELFLRMAQAGSVAHTPRPLSNFRIHRASKTSTLNAVSREEVALIREQYCSVPPSSMMSPLVSSWYWGRLFGKMLVEGCLYEKVINQLRRRISTSASHGTERSLDQRSSRRSIG